MGRAKRVQAELEMLTNCFSELGITELTCEGQLGGIFRLYSHCRGMSRLETFEPFWRENWLAMF